MYYYLYVKKANDDGLKAFIIHEENLSEAAESLCKNEEDKIIDYLFLALVNSQVVKSLNPEGLRVYYADEEVVTHNGVPRLIEEMTKLKGSKIEAAVYKKAFEHTFDVVEENDIKKLFLEE